jgi:hypothetical protein
MSREGFRRRSRVPPQTVLIWQASGIGRAGPPDGETPETKGPSRRPGVILECNQVGHPAPILTNLMD